jgi:hypothetical protein
MDDRVHTMTREREAISVLFLKFMRLLSKNPETTMCFFEGEDQKYYSVRLNLASNNFTWKGIDCKGKKNVLELHGLIEQHTEYKNSKVAYFVDRDFDNPIDTKLKKKIFETPCYSIENLYCSLHCLANILAIEFKLDNDNDKPDLHADVLEHFSKMQNEFHAAIRIFNAWIKAHRTKEHREGWKSLNLNNVSLEKFIQIEANKISAQFDVDKIQTLFPGCYAISEKELQEAEEVLPKTNEHLHFRGKYELEFIRKYLENIRKECADQNSDFYNKNCSIKLSFSKGNFISEVSQYADTPVELREFLTELTADS